MSEITLEGIEKLLDERDAKLKEYVDKEIESFRTEAIIAFELLNLDNFAERLIHELDKFSTNEAWDYFMNHPKEKYRMNLTNLTVKIIKRTIFRRKIELAKTVKE